MQRVSSLPEPASDRSLLLRETSSELILNYRTSFPPGTKETNIVTVAGGFRPGGCDPDGYGMSLNSVEFYDVAVNSWSLGIKIISYESGFFKKKLS